MYWLLYSNSSPIKKHVNASCAINSISTFQLVVLFLPSLQTSIYLQAAITWPQQIWVLSPVQQFEHYGVPGRMWNHHHIERIVSQHNYKITMCWRISLRYQSEYNYNWRKQSYASFYFYFILFFLLNLITKLIIKLTTNIIIILIYIANIQMQCSFHFSW
jgi:hypothetical protein